MVGLFILASYWLTVPRYSMTGNGLFAYRLDRFTGEVLFIRGFKTDIIPATSHISWWNRFRNWWNRPEVRGLPNIWESSPNVSNQSIETSQEVSTEEEVMRISLEDLIEINPNNFDQPSGQ